MTDVSVSLRAKRKRGRPRKDSNLCTLQSPDNSTLLKAHSKDESVDAGLVGSIVYGVIEGAFDAGYLISVRIGNNQTPFRGLVFQPKKFVPITASNDIAPQAKMYHRREFPVPVYDNLNQTTTGFAPPLQASKQAVMRPVLPASTPLSVPPYSPTNHSSFMVSEPMMIRTSSCSNMGAQITGPKSPNSEVCKQFSYVHPSGSSLRMVEEDEVMQAFEVSTSSGGSKNNVGITQENQVHSNDVGSNAEQLHPNLMEDMPPFRADNQQEEMQPIMFCNEPRTSDVNYNQNLGTDQSHQSNFIDSISKSPDLKLDLAFTVHEKKPLTPDTEAAGETNYSVQMKSSNFGYHQALVAGNPLLLPPDIISEPLEFMMEKPKSPQNCKNHQETNMEVGGENPSASYKLELATPQSALNNDMSYVVNETIQPSESRSHRCSPSQSR